MFPPLDKITIDEMDDYPNAHLIDAYLFRIVYFMLKSIRYFMFRRIRAILFMLNKIFEVLLMLKRIRAFFFMLKKIRAVLFMLKIIIEVLFMLKRIREVLSMLKRISATPLCLAIVYLVIKNIMFDINLVLSGHLRFLVRPGN